MENIKKFLFVNSSTKQTILKNIVWLSGGVTISRILRSLMIIYAARILGAEGYGIFSYAISFAAIFNVFSDIGLSGLLTRELITRTDKKEYLATSLVLKTTLVILTTIFIAFIAPLFTNISEVKPLMILMALLVGFDSMRSFIFAISRSENRMQFEAILEIITEIFITTTGLIVLFKIPSVENFALGYTLASGVGFVLVLVLMKEYIVTTFSHFRKELVETIFKSAWPFAFIGFFGIFMTNIDSIIVGFLKSTTDLGLLAAAQKPISMLYLIPGLLYTTLFPFISKFIKNKEEDKLLKLLKTSLTASIGLALPIVLGGIIVAGPLINVIYGYGYIGAVLTFQILLLTLLPIFPGMTLSSTLLAEDKQYVFVKSSLVGAIINITLDLILIPVYGIAGSAIATLCAQLAVNGIFLIEVRKNHNISILKDTKKMFFAVFLMGISVFLMKTLLWPLILIIFIASVIYFGVLFLLKEKLLKEIIDGART